MKLFGRTINSNSTYRTLGEIMGVDIQPFPGVAEPGVRNRMVDRESIGLQTHDTDADRTGQSRRWRF
ncbi:MAG: hypothetical protein R3E42_08095 [Burkholderiaceae bacterium]